MVDKNKDRMFGDQFYFEGQKDKIKNEEAMENKVSEEMENNEELNDDDRHNSNARAAAALEQNYPRIDPENL